MIVFVLVPGRSPFIPEDGHQQEEEEDLACVDAAATAVYPARISQYLGSLVIVGDCDGGRLLCGGLVGIGFVVVVGGVGAMVV